LLDSLMAQGYPLYLSSSLTLALGYE